MFRLFEITATWYLIHYICIMFRLFEMTTTWYLIHNICVIFSLFEMATTCYLIQCIYNWYLMTMNLIMFSCRLLETNSRTNESALELKCFKNTPAQQDILSIRCQMELYQRANSN